MKFRRKNVGIEMPYVDGSILINWRFLEGNLSLRLASNLLVDTSRSSAEIIWIYRGNHPVKQRVHNNLI